MAARFFIVEADDDRFSRALVIDRTQPVRGYPFAGAEETAATVLNAGDRKIEDFLYVDLSNEEAARVAVILADDEEAAA
jgi:hypothetical protein